MERFPQLGKAATGRVTARATNDTNARTHGFSGVYHGFAWMPESVQHGLTDAGRARELAYVRHSRLAIARTWFGADWTMPEWGGPLQWDTVRAQAFISWLDATAAAGCQVAVNGGWWFPENVRSFGPPEDIAPTPKDLEIFVSWLTKSVRYLRVELGYTHIRYIHLFTEPREKDFVYGRLPAGEEVQAYYTTVVKAVAERAHRTEGLRGEVKLVAPNCVPLASSRVALRDAVSDLDGVVDIFSCHDYGNFQKSTMGNRRYDAWYDAVSAGVNDVRDLGSDAPFWLDEHGWLTRAPEDEAYRATPDYGTYAVESALAAMNAGAETSMLWLFADQHYAWPIHDTTNADSFESGCHRYGLIPWDPDRALVRPGWYSFALAARALGGGGGRVHSVGVDQPGIHAGVVTHAHGDVTALLVNATEAPATIRLDLAPLDEKGRLRRYVVDPAQLPDDPFAFTDADAVNTPHPSGALTEVVPSGAVVALTSRDLSSSD